jgi:hypothetical protein
MTGRRKAKGALKDRDNNRHVDVKKISIDFPVIFL